MGEQRADRSAAPPPVRTPVAPAPPRVARVIARRPGLPGGRAVLGALLVVTAGVGTFALATHGDDGPSTAYAVLARSVDPGERVEAADVTWRRMELDRDVAERAFADAAELDDAVALVPLAEGELLQRGSIVTGAAAETARADQLTIPVPLERTPPGLRRGEPVAVLATYGSGADASTVVTVQRATVLAHESDPEGIGSSSTGRLTLSLPGPDSVVATAHAAQVAELTIVRLSGTHEPLPESYQREPQDRHVPDEAVAP